MKLLLWGMMAYFAQLGALNIVERVIVADQAFIDRELLGSKHLWVETSYTGQFRGRYAGRGQTFNPLTETFTTAALDASVLGNVITPADQRLDISDAPPIAERSNIRLRFLRPIDDSGGYNLRAVAPGARLRFASNATALEFGLKFTDFARTPDSNTATLILVDGVAHTSFASDTANGTPSTKKVSLSFNDATPRLIELVWPYGDSLDFLYLRTNAGATVSKPTARPTRKICLIGDSISQGFFASSVASGWAFQLGAQTDSQVVNMGYGGSPAQLGDAQAVPADCTTIIYAMGFNNAYAGQSAATFQSIIAANLQAMRTKVPTVPIYAASPIYSTALNLAAYRTAMQNAVTAANDPDIHYVNGLSLMTNAANRLVDGIHPNDLGASEIATSLAAALD
jgi:lysophospholipase L1-like esterase